MAEKKQISHWCFTHYDLDNRIKFDSDIMSYMVSQIEKCPKTGKLHQQGYIELLRKKTMGGLKKALGVKSIHLEQRRGTARQAAEYCMKPDTQFEKPIEEGKISQQGARTDLETYVDRIKAGDNELTLMNECTNVWARHSKLYQRTRELVLRHTPKPDPFVWVLCGESGTGKSLISHLIGEYIGSMYSWTGNQKWLDGYDGEQCLIIDDYDGAICDKNWLQLTDRYKYKAEVKGCHTWVISPLIFITCNDMEWAKFKGTERRITLFSEVQRLVK